MEYQWFWGALGAKMHFWGPKSHFREKVAFLRNLGIFAEKQLWSEKCTFGAPAPPPPGLGPLGPLGRAPAALALIEPMEFQHSWRSAIPGGSQKC